MNYNEALMLFGFTDNFTKKELKKRYLELSKKYHPDLNGDEETMKKINSAYEALKSHNESSDLVKYYDSLKERLKFFASKTIYLPDTIEYKYAYEINDIIEKFFFSNTKMLLEFKYHVIVGKIKTLFVDYKKEALKRVPDYFISKFDTFDSNCSFDDYVKLVNKIGIKYDEVNNALNNVIKSMSDKMSFGAIEEISDIKEIIIKSIIDKRITLEDGVNRLQAEIEAKILKDKELNKNIWDTYNSIREDLKPFDTEDIDIIMQVLFNKDLAILKNVYNKGKVQKEDIKYELYIASKDVDDGFGIVLKRNEDNKFVTFLKNEKDMLEEYLITSEGFYNKYCRLKDYLEEATFWGSNCFVQAPSLSPQKAILLNYCGGVAIVLVEDDEIIALKDNEFFLKEPYGTINDAEKYRDKQVLYDKIYDSFFGRVEEIKLKREKNI